MTNSNKRPGQNLPIKISIFLVGILTIILLALVFGGALLSTLGIEKTSCDPLLRPAALESQGRYWPINSSLRVVVSCFGKRLCQRDGEVCGENRGGNKGINILAEEDDRVFAVAAGQVVNYSMKDDYVIIKHYVDGHKNFKAKYEGLKSLCGFGGLKRDDSGFKEGLKDKEAGGLLGNASGPYFHIEFFRENKQGKQKSRDYFDPLAWYGKDRLKDYNINFSQDCACVYWSNHEAFKQRSYIDYATNESNQYDLTETVEVR